MFTTEEKHESIRTHAFREFIRTEMKEHGTVGFDRIEGKDLCEIVQWTEDGMRTVHFEVEAMPVIALILLRAYLTRTRPNENDCYAFQRLSR